MDQWQRLHRRQFHTRRYRDSHAARCPRQSLTHTQIPSGWMGWPYIDTLYDYAQFIKHGDESQNAGSIASLPEAHWNAPVAIIGAGAAGLAAAYELLKIGASPVVFEADPQRLGGRVYALPFTDADGNPDPSTFAEMGAMRIPLSSRLLFHYVNNVFGLQTAEAFPNPGTVPTKLSYENSVIDWPAGRPCPPGFEDIYNDWQNFIEQLVSPLSHALQIHGPHETFSGMSYGKRRAAFMLPAAAHSFPKRSVDYALIKANLFQLQE